MSVMTAGHSKTIDEASHWQDIHELVSVCGQADSPKRMVLAFLDNIDNICRFDQAFAYHMDDNHNICDVHTVNIDSHWRDMYLEYYAKTVHQYREDCQSQTGDGAGSACHPQLHDFGSMTSAYFAPNTDFIPNYVRPRGLVYSYGFPLKDMDGNNRAIIALDRVSRHCFSHSELHSLQMIVPQINNLYKNFFYQRAVLDDREYQALGGYRLSPRELEVVKLLCRGISPINISKNLSITLATAHKHIANIHKKLNVSSQQELLNRFLWRSS